MKKSIVFYSLFFGLIGNPVFAQRLSWPLGDVSVDKLDQRVFTYHMYDTSGIKVGSMVTQLTVDDDQILFIDTSRFDNGSVSENARFVFVKNPIRVEKARIVMKTTRSELEYNFDMSIDSVKGNVLIGGDDRPVLIPACYDITRAELYAFLHALDFTKKFKHELKVFEPTSVRIADASIEFLEQVEIKTANGVRTAYKLFLDGKEAIPSNVIYIDKESRHDMKYEVLTPTPLDIVLVNVN